MLYLNIHQALNPMKIHELGHVVLFVSNLERSRRFYHQTLGFPEIPSREPGMAIFSTGRTHHELLLLEIDAVPRPKSRPEPGLYHIGFKIGNSDQDLKEAIQELEAAHVRIVGLTDHTVTHSLYILDPDGNELELYIDVSEEWRENPSLVAAPTRHLEL
jgi:catechol-2,3-dioxygenase